MTSKRRSILLVALTVVLLAAPAVSAQSSHASEIDAWRMEREAVLKSDDGWLTVSGLFWLKEGVNTIGAAAGRDIRLPAGSAPELAGEILFRNEKAIFRVAPGVTATLGNQAIHEAALKSDAEEHAEPVVIGDLSLHLIRRGARLGIRLKDKNSLARKHFTRLEWFEVTPEYRIVAEFIPYDVPKDVSIVNIIGDVEQKKSPGIVTFKLNGHEYSLEPVTSSGGRLFFVFRDLTSGNETYKPGRFLYADPPVEGKVVLDFNKAINPPCAFTAYATCPLPTRRNYLQVKIEAGEKVYHAPWHEIAGR